MFEGFSQKVITLQYHYGFISTNSHKLLDKTCVTVFNFYPSI